MSHPDHPRRARASLFVLLVLATLAAAGGPVRGQGADITSGTIRGSVYDKDFGVPLPGARVTIVELGLASLTTKDGVFTIDRVPAGSYTLSFSKEGFERELENGVTVSAGRVTDLRVELATEIVELDELVVSGGDFLDNPEMQLLEIRAAAVTVQDSISADMIKQAGASDVGDALKMVVGASVVDGKYATVRGLSDRYTGVTLNGVRVPSADPRRRAVQVDLFPTGTIESVVVTKTFMPDLQGDFTGGGIDIKTKDIPEGPTASFSTSLEYNSLATGNPDFLTYRDGGVPFSGFAGSSRSLPAIADTKAPPFPRASLNPTPEQVEAADYYNELTRSFVPVMGVSQEEVGPNFGFSLQGGNRFGIGAEDTLGLIGAITYSRKNYFYSDGQFNSGGVNNVGDEIQLTSEWNDNRGTEEVLIGALGSIAWVPNEDHSYSLRLAGNQGALDDARFQYQPRGEVIVQNQSLTYTQRSVLSAQLSGSDEFPEMFGKKDDAIVPGLELDWVLSWNYTRQEEPDVRFFRNIFDPNSGAGAFPNNSSEVQNTRRIFRDINETNWQGSVNAVLPFVSAGVDGNIKLGLYGESSDRTYTQRSFTFRYSRQVGSGPAVDVNRSYSSFIPAYPGQLWTDVFMEPDRIGLAPNRCEVSAPPCAPAPNQLIWSLLPLGTDVDYDGLQNIFAGYAMATVPLARAVKLIGGARQESTTIEIVPFNPTLGTVEVIEVQPSGERALIRVPDDQAQADLDDDRLLPALALVYELATGMNLRASYAQTLARPTFRELAPVATEEFLSGDEFIGNPDLQISSIENYDLRWEWFPNPGDVLAASVFFKTLTDPIEYISFGVANRAFVQPVNYPAGSVKGIEVEGRVAMAGLWDALSGFAFGLNASWLHSSVDVPASEQKSLETLGLAQATRPLQGQPAYLVNVNATYDNPDSGTTVGIFFNRIGRTLLTGAARGVEDGIPDVYEEPFSSLDVTFSQEFGEGASFGLKAGNLLAPDRLSLYETPGGITAIKAERPTARTYSASLGYTW